MAYHRVRSMSLLPWIYSRLNPSSGFSHALNVPAMSPGSQTHEVNSHSTKLTVGTVTLTGCMLFLLQVSTCLSLHYMRVEMLIVKPTTRNNPLHHRTKRLQVLRRSIPCSPTTRNRRLGSLPIHSTRTQRLQIQHRHWVPGTLFGNRRRGAKV